MKNMSRIVELVAEEYDILPTDIYSHTRGKTVSAARKVAMYLARELTGCSYHELGDHFHRSHAAVIYAVKTWRPDEDMVRAYFAVKHEVCSPERASVDAEYATSKAIDDEVYCSLPQATAPFSMEQDIAVYRSVNTAVNR